MVITETLLFWILVLGGGLVILEIAILYPYRKKVTITRKTKYTIAIIVIFGLVAQLSVFTQIGFFSLQSQKDFCLAYELSQMPINQTKVRDCLTKLGDQEFSLITVNVILTVVTSIIEIRELAKNREE